MLLKANKYRKDKKADCRRNEFGSRIFMGRVFGDYAKCLHFYPSFSYGRIIAGESTILGKNGLIDSIQVFAAAKEGDTAAQQTLESAFDMLGKALAYMACVIDPEVFVIGGGVSNAGEVLRHGVEQAYKRYCFHASTDTKIILASLGNDAGIYGACRMAAQIEERYSANERYGGRSVPCDQKADM